MARKLQEVELALWLERKHTKAEILELYLNRVYFGSGAYGVKRWRKNISASPQRMSRSRKRRCSRASSNRLLVSRRTAIPEGAEKRTQPCLLRWPTRNSSPTRRRRRQAPILPPP